MTDGFLDPKHDSQVGWNFDERKDSNPIRLIKFEPITLRRLTLGHVDLVAD
jgi:hypothetical protein